jgi:hypothetical protein
MSAGRIAAPDSQLRAPFIAVVLVFAFSVGVVTGFSLPRSVGSGSHVATAPGPAVPAPSFAGVADNNMSDAARRAVYGPAVQAPLFAGVADNNMSDAARRAMNGSGFGDH